MTLRFVFSSVVDVLAPRRCPACDLPLSEGDQDTAAGFCGACGPLLERAPRVMRPPCRIAACYEFAGPLADAVRRFKYASRLDLAKPLGDLLAAQTRPYGGLVDEVVPVPLHPSRLRERGFNPAAMIARPAARALGVPLRCRRLSRVRPTPSQASLPATERRTNMRGAFRAKRRHPTVRVLLVDDVCTTGATLRAAAHALHDAGVVDVYRLALAYAKDDFQAAGSGLGLPTPHAIFDPTGEVRALA